MNQKNNISEHDALFKLEVLTKEKEIVRRKLAVTAEELAKSYELLEQKVTVRTKDLEDANRAAQNVLEDLEEEKKKLDEARIKNEAILASIGDGLVVVDKEGKTLLVNNAFEDLVGWTENEVLGKLLVEILPREDEVGNIVPFKERILTEILSTTTTTTTTTTDWYYMRKNKTRFPAASIITPFVIDGKVSGAVEVFRDITKEKEIDKAKTEFVSLASHQLRTPLGIMKWYLEVLQKDAYLEKASKTVLDYFSEIVKNNERVLSLVRELLSVSRIDQGRVKNDPKPISLVDIVTETVKEMEILAKTKNITLKLMIKQQQVPKMQLDPLLFHEVMANLIANSLEYTPARGSVNVALDRSNDSIRISIQDSGIGVSREEQKNLFTKFYRAEKAVNQNPEGSGLGLYVAKSYVEGWGGTISVESAVGQGSTFIISLPISQKE